MKVLITGGAGFIGANLAEKFLHLGDEVCILDDLSTGNTENLTGLDVELLEGSILDSDLVNKLVANVDSVLHLAAIPSVPRSVAAPLPSHNAIVNGTLNMLEAVRANNGHIVMASSSSVYGANPTLPKSEDLRPMPISPYAVAKLAAESYTVAWHLTYGLDTLAFRFFNVFGPRQRAGHAYAAVIPCFLDRIKNGEPVDIYGDGEQTRDFTYVGDVVDVLARAAHERKAAHSPVNLAFGSRRSLNQLVEKLAHTTGKEVTANYLDPRVGDVRDSQASSTLLNELFDNPATTNFEDALQVTTEWFMAL